MATNHWTIDDVDRPESPRQGILQPGDRIAVTRIGEDLVTVEIPGKIPLLRGTLRVRRWFHWIEGYDYDPALKIVHLFQALWRVNGEEHWLEGFLDRIDLSQSSQGDVRDTETWTATKPPTDPPDE